MNEETRICRMEWPSMKTLGDDIDGMLVNSTARDRRVLAVQMLAVGIFGLAALVIAAWRVLA